MGVLGVVAIYWQIIVCAVCGWIFRLRRWMGFKGSRKALHEISDSLDTSTITYAMVWEDSVTLREGVSIQHGDRIATIASGGDNALAMLLDDPSVVIAMDYCPCQVALCELKKYAIQYLQLEQVRCLLGYTATWNTLTAQHIYTQLLRQHLPQALQKFWDERHNVLARGILHQGLYELYHLRFGKYIRPLAHSSDKIRKLLSMSDPMEQAEYYDTVIDTALWRTVCKFYFGDVLVGRCPPFYERATQDVGSHFLSRIRHVMRNVPANNNYFLEFVLLGDISGQCGYPEYLTQGKFDIVKSRIEKVQFLQGDVLEFMKKSQLSFQVVDLSNIFDFIPESAHDTYRKLVMKHTPGGGRVCHWNFVPFSGDVLEDTVRAFSADAEVMTPLSKRLNSLERAWFYQTFTVQVVKYTEENPINGYHHRSNGFQISLD